MSFHFSILKTIEMRFRIRKNVLHVVVVIYTLFFFFSRVVVVHFYKVANSFQKPLRVNKNQYMRITYWDSWKRRCGFVCTKTKITWEAESFTKPDHTKYRTLTHTHKPLRRKKRNNVKRSVCLKNNEKSQEQINIHVSNA